MKEEKSLFSALINLSFSIMFLVLSILSLVQFLINPILTTGLSLFGIVLISAAFSYSLKENSSKPFYYIMYFSGFGILIASMVL